MEYSDIHFTITNLPNQNLLEKLKQKLKPI